MEKLKQSLAVKIAAFVLLVGFVVVTVCSAFIVLENMSYERYTKSPSEVESEVYYGLTEDIAVMAWNWYLDEKKTGETLYGSDYLLEIYNGKWKGVGYQIYENTGKGKISNESAWQKNLSVEDKSYYKNSFYLPSDDSRAKDRVDVFIEKIPNNPRLPTELKLNYNRQNNGYERRHITIAGAILGAIACPTLITFLFRSVGKRKKAGFSPLSKVPLEPAIGIFVFVFLWIGEGVRLLLYTPDDSRELESFGVILTLTVWIATFLAIVMLFTLEVKAGTWWKCSITARIVNVLKVLIKKAAYLIRGIPLVPKTAITLGVLFSLNLFLATGYYFDVAARLGMIFLWIVICVCVIYITLGLQKLKWAGKRLAEGELSYKLDKKGLKWDLADHADSLNNIGNGIARAVEEKSRSERFKAELITNVSHDIKTPLTSIISYVDFLKKEDLNNEKAKEYISVLDRQSQRLKKLTEDLVDASKAATGSIQIDLEPCEIGILMMQTVGEYDEKAKNNHLEFVVKLPQKELEILADGRRLWRVFDNLLNNICKYAMPGTRVYLTLEEVDSYAVITYKNISKYELDISGEELMERFVRGDKSRYTEGSGLGLSISQNLVELQRGTFEITVDGDLFKVVMQFKLI